MGQIKEMKIRVSSLIENLDSAGLPEGDAEKSELSESGFLKLDGDGLTLSYTEKGDSSRVACDIKTSGDTVRVIRSGDVVSEMVFEKGKVHKSVYRVPPFSFDMEIKTLRLENSLGANGGKLTLVYNMILGGQVKKCRLSVLAESSEGGTQG